jgi:hypothetical protein
MIKLNKKGSSLMQVMVMGALIAAIVAVVLRFSTISAVNVNKTKRDFVFKSYADSCMAKINAEAVRREFAGEAPLSGKQYKFCPEINGFSADVDFGFRVDDSGTDENLGAGNNTAKFQKIVIQVTQADKL